MALLQIAEPGLSTEPHKHRLAVGIDLGTTNSLVATVRNGVPVVLSDEQGRPLLPSVVRYRNDGGVDVGYPAYAVQARDPRNTIVSVKRFMGRGLKDVAHMRDDALRLRRCRGHGAAAHRRRGEDSGGGLGGDPQGAARARRGEPGRRTRRRRDHRTCLFRRRPAPGDQGRGQARRPQRAAPAQRTYRRGDCLRPGQRLGRRLRCL